MITFTTRAREQDLNYGYRAFRIYRIRLAEKLDEELGKLYSDTMLMLREPEIFNYKFNKLVSGEAFRGKEAIIEFLCMSDCEGQLNATVCRQIADIMQDDDPLTAIMRWCAENRRKLVWY